MDTENAGILLGVLEESLGVSREHVLDVLTRQAVAQGVTAVLILVMLAAFTFWSTPRIKKLYSGGGNEFDKELLASLWSMTLFALLVVSFVFAAVNFPKLINPEYYAIREVLELFN